MEISVKQREFIRQRRKELNKPLSYVAEKADIAISTLSSIETGKLVSITDDLYLTILDVLGSSEALESQAKLTVGFGHCLWATPFILMLQNSEQLIGMEAYSFGELDAIDSESLKPIKIKESKDIGEVPGPDINQKTFMLAKNEQIDSGNQQLVTRGKNAKLKALTAPQLLDDFESGQNNVLIIPPIVLENYNRDKYLKIASLVYSSSGGTQLSIFSTNHLLTDHQVSLKKWIDLLVKLNNDSDTGVMNKIIILYPRNTVCEQHYKGPFSYFLSHWENLLIEEEEIEDLADYEKTAQQVSELLQNKTSTYVVFLLAWHPLTYWIEHKVKQTVLLHNNAINPLHFDLIQEMDNVSQPIVFEFSIMVDKDRFIGNKYDQKMIDTMLENLFFNIRQLNNDIDKFKLILLSLIGTDKRIPESLIPERIKRVAKYLRMKPQDCAEALVKISFFLSIHPDFYFLNKTLKS